MQNIDKQIDIINLCTSFFAWLKESLPYIPGKPLVFSDLEFWVFMLVFLFVFSFTAGIRKVKNAVLLLFSFYFYYKSGGWAILILLLVISYDFFIARAIDAARKQGVKKFWVGLSVVLNLLILAYFKYAFLLADGLNNLFHLNIKKENWLALLLPAGDMLRINTQNILLPVGISFFIFHSLSYTIDVYRGLVKPLRNWSDYALFVAFFPELVAGPIVRARDFVDQIFRDYRLDRATFGKGISLILTGLVKKVVISDILSTHLVDRIFDQPGLASGPEAWLAMYGYGIQIFCDFSGYTDIAIGLAAILGFELKPNFDQPYKSVSVTEFWRRWHISLSVWLRDYLYIPLGGNRNGKVFTYINLMITMLLGGLWHGANWKFLIWGGMHGLGLVVHKLWSGAAGRFQISFSAWAGWLITFHFALICWLPFRAENTAVALELFRKLCLPWDFVGLGELLFHYRLPLFSLVLGLVTHFLPESWKTAFTHRFEKSPIPLLWLICLLTLLLVYQFKSAESQPFIYFQF
jgi:D-alanyl-lipoteichoic acid acyltransferase DltB (MBOAT superfamily)